MNSMWNPSTLIAPRFLVLPELSFVDSHCTDDKPEAVQTVRM